MRSFYPAIRPYTSHRIEVGNGHTLYAEECGTPDGVPVLFVHGGPGAGCSEQDRRFFDPEKYRIILFDQRGAGRSRPHAELDANTTRHLLTDIEQLRAELQVERWLLFGGSWGSTLSLLYAEAHPERVLGLVLRGIFLCRKADIDWFYRQGARCIFPDYWQDFVAQIPPEERDDLLQAYYRRLTGDNEITRMAAAKAWSLWEARCATHDPSPQVVARFGNPQVALAMARIEAHYFVNHSFIRENQICAEAHRLADIPTVIVHGRYDLVCPVDQAFALHDALPHAELEIIRDAGHASSEPGTLDALIRATDRFARELAPEILMRGLLQRVRRAVVRVANMEVGAIGPGVLLLVGFAPDDTPARAEALLDRVLRYRLFADAEGRMNLSLLDTGGGLLIVSQFTLLADTRKGLRPSFTPAAPPAQAQALYDHFVTSARARHQPVACGRFGADMQVELVNDGPVTLLLDAPG